MRLDVVEPLRITADSGALLRVTASPAEVLAELRALRIVDAEDPGAANPSVGIRLRCSDRRTQFPARRSPPIPFDASGVAVLDGVPPGVWRAFFEWQNGYTSQRLELSDVTLWSGQQTDLPLDLAPLRPATMRGTVMLEGRPLADRDVHLESNRNHSLRTDTEGRFVFAGASGSYRLTAMCDRGRSSLASGEAVTLAPGEARDGSFALHAGTLTVRFVGVDGLPVAGVHEARVLRKPGDWAATLPDSDEEGRAALPLVQAGTLSLRVMPRRYASITAKQEWMKENPDKNLAALDLDLGLIVVEAGRDNIATVVLPAAYLD